MKSNFQGGGDTDDKLLKLDYLKTKLFICLLK